LGEPILAAQFTDVAILTYGRLMAQESKDEETEGVKAPAEFKAGAKWKPFNEGCIAFFNPNLGMDRVPFSYAIREFTTLFLACDFYRWNGDPCWFVFYP